MNLQNLSEEIQDDLQDKKLLYEENEICGYTMNDSKLLQQFLEKEAAGQPQVVRKCELHTIECPACTILNKGNSEMEDKII